jgi:tRNA A-37 threonylcarbamoyl transferase component Bud32
MVRSWRVDDEVPLEGGMLTAGVVRIGDTVRRPIGPHSARVHEVLRSLEAAGFEEAPRFLGIDQEGREILTYAPGVTMWPGLPHLLGTDETLDRAGRLIRRLHDVLGGRAHGDLGAWNLVVDVETDRWTIIDWDEAADDEPASEDLPQCVLSFCDLWAQTCPPPDEAARRIRRFADAYGIEEGLTDIVERIPRLCWRNAAIWVRRGTAPEQIEVWQRHAQHGDVQLPAWLAALD